MTDYTARNVLLKDSSGNYLIPYTEKADLSLGNLNSAGKAYVAIKGYDSTATYSLNEVVMTVVSGSVKFYRSLVDNNTANLSDTTKWEEVELGGGSVDIDNSTITLNSDDEIQTVGVIDNRSGSVLKLWTGTRSQYNAIQNKDANTLYNITDDTGDLDTFANTDLSNLSAEGNDKFVTKDTTQEITAVKTFSATPICTNSLTATDNSFNIPTTAWCQSNIGVLDFSSASEVTASVFGANYTPSYKGILIVKTLFSAGNCTLTVKNSAGTSLWSKRIEEHTDGFGNSAGGSFVLPVNPNFKYNFTGGTAGTAGTNYWAMFIPYNSH